MLLLLSGKQEEEGRGLLRVVDQIKEKAVIWLQELHHLKGASLKVIPDDLQLLKKITLHAYSCLWWI